MPNTNIEENMKAAVGSLMFQSIQYQTLINQLQEHVQKLEADLAALKSEAAAK